MQVKSNTKAGGKTGIVFFMLFVNLCLSSLLYEFIMIAFDIDTGGFINLTPIFVAGISWMIISLLAIILACTYKKQLQDYYRTVLVTEIVSLCLPLFLLFVVTTILFVSKATNH